MVVALCSHHSEIEHVSFILRIFCVFENSKHGKCKQNFVIELNVYETNFVTINYMQELCK